MFKKLLALALALALGGTCATYAEDSIPGEWIAPEVMEFGDWSVACDNARECTAVNVSRDYRKRIESTDPGDYATPKLWVKRRAGPGARPRVFVDTSVWGETNDVGPLTLHVYYDCDGDCTGRAYTLTHLEPGRYEIAPSQLATFFAESRKTSRAATRRSDGSMHGIITTDGLVAAMRYIDENQSRRGTVTAIYAKGKMPSGTVPTEPDRPEVKVIRAIEEPTTEMHYNKALQQKRREYCEGDKDWLEPDIQRFGLSNGQKLWSILCNRNPHDVSRLWLIQTGENSFTTYRVPRPEQGRPAEDPVLPNSSFDPSTGQITSYSNGMCGWRRRWAWTGMAFEMIDSIEMPTCLDILPNQWLQTYRAIPE